MRLRDLFTRKVEKTDKPIENEPIENEPIENEPIENEPIENEPIENEPKTLSMKISISIKFKDGSFLSYHQIHELDAGKTYIQCYRKFYKWFFFRRQSQWYSFTHTTGTKIINRDNIYQINFDYSEVLQDS